MSGEVWIDDIDLGTNYNFTLGQIGDVATTQRSGALAHSHASAPQLQDAVSPLLGQLGYQWMGEPVQSPSRSLIVGGYVVGGNLGDYRLKIDSIKAVLANGAKRLRFGDRPTQEFRDGRLLQFSATPRSALLQNIFADVSFSLEFVDPLRYDLTPQAVPLSTARAPLPMGDGPTFAAIIIHGGGSSLTNPSLTLRAPSGEQLQAMGFTGTLGANDYLVVDTWRAQVTKSVAGVQSDAFSWWTSGDFPVFVGTDGSIEVTGANAQISLQLAASAGTPAGIATYARTWL